MAPVYPISSGHPAYSGNFIPEIWSGKLIENFYDTTVLGAIANTDYEGEIRSMGDTVHIRTTPKVTIRDYVKGQTLETERPDSPPIELLIDQGEYFSCVLDDVDAVQMDIAMMNEWGRDAAEEMKIHIDTKILAGMLPDVGVFNKGPNAGRISGAYNLGTDDAPRAITAATDDASADDATSLLIDLCSVLEEANAPMEKWVVIPSKLANRLKKGDIRRADITGDGANSLRNGMIGSINDMTIYVSHLLHTTAARGEDLEYHVIAGHKMGLTFASQLTKTETLRSEKTFGDVLRGLQVYGYKVVKPEALASAVITVA